MRFRPNGKTVTRRAIRLAVATFAVAAIAITGPALSAQAAGIHSVALTSAESHTRSRLVPQVVGWSAADAGTALHSHGFSYVFKPPRGHKVKKPSHWTVTKQSPKGRTHTSTRTKIVLTVVKTSVYLSQGVRSFYAQDYGTFPTISQAGTGTDVFLLPTGAGAAIVRASYSGGGTFSIVELGKGGIATNRVLVSASGPYAGATALGLTTVKVPTTAIRVTGSGSWRITIIPIASASVIATPAAGRGDRVYLYSGPPAIWTVSSPGPTTFMLDQISSSSSPNLAVNESGSWAGQIALQPGPSVVEIHSSGPWTIH
jgi:hypothetical protein